MPIAIAPVADRLSPRSKNQGNAERRSVTQSPTAGPKLIDWSVLGLKLPGHMKSVKLRLASHGALTVMPLPTEGQRRDVSLDQLDGDATAAWSPHDGTATGPW